MSVAARTRATSSSGMPMATTVPRPGRPPSRSAGPVRPVGPTGRRGFGGSGRRPSWPGPSWRSPSWRPSWLRQCGHRHLVPGGGVGRPARPGPRPAGRSAPGRASSSRSRARPRRRSAIDSGSPPCSPHTPTLRSGTGGPAPLGAEADQLADAVGVDHLERVALEQALLQIGRHHPALDVVAAEAERHLGQVVGAEGEELGLLGDLAGPQGGPGRLDHGADEDLEVAG